MKLGRLIREKEYGVFVSGVCHSSCVYLLAAGLTRTVPDVEPQFINVGIHRPYFTVYQGEQTDVVMKQMLEYSRKYFHEMNISPSLADDMFSIPPENIKILEEEELAKYRLNQMDMAYKEKVDIMGAKRYGMTRIEYMETRKKYNDDVEKFCTLDKIKVAVNSGAGGETMKKLLDENKKCIENFKYKHGVFEKNQ